MRSIEDILTDWFAGVTLSGEEHVYLHSWLEDPEHRREFERMELVKRNAYAFFAGAETDYAHLWQQVQKQGNKRLLIRRVMKYAACLLLPLALGVFIFLNDRGKESEVAERFPADGNLITRGSGLPALVLASGREILLDTADHSLSGILACNGVMTGEQTLKYEGVQPGKHVLKVPRGAEYRLVLSDQTVVWVNAESELEYPVTFDGSERRVKLRGEAYFEVAKDSLHPFIVETNRAVAKVLGTSFNVSDYVGERADITLAEGRLEVALRHDKSAKCLLTPNENVRIDGQLTLQKDIDMDEYIGWRKGVISFHKKRLEEVFTKLSRWYDFEYVFTDAGLKDYVFTAWFDRNDPFNTIVKRLERTGRIRTEIKGRQVMVYNVER